MEGFAESFAKKEDRDEFCEKVAKTIKNADRVAEMKQSLFDIPYPFTCVIESKDMDKLDKELVKANITPKADEVGIRNVEMLIREGQTIERFLKGQPTEKELDLQVEILEKSIFER